MENELRLDEMLALAQGVEKWDCYLEDYWGKVKGTKINVHICLLIEGYEIRGFWGRNVRWYGGEIQVFDNDDLYLGRATREYSNMRDNNPFKSLISYAKKIDKMKMSERPKKILSIRTKRVLKKLEEIK